MAEIKVTDAVEEFFEWLEDKGVVSWGNPDGVIVSSDVRACVESVIAMGAGGSVQVTRSNGRVTNLAISGYDTSGYDAGRDKMEDAIDSYDDKDIGPGEGYSP
jgi:hypothetical protein